tara:strand:- start:273 stop:1247 length:975 start_codon:yes stop_codon:yes gene_type:complete
MSTIIFPNTPTHLETYIDPNQATWQFDSDGPYWNVITSTTRKNFSGTKIENTSAFSLGTSYALIEFDTPEFNIDNYYINTQKGRITVPSTGFYRIFCSFFTSSEGSGSSYSIQLRKNGNTVALEETNIGPNQNTTLDETLSLNEGDYLEIWGKESTGTGEIQANSTFQVYRIGFAPGTGVSNHVAFSGARAILNSSSNTSNVATAVTWNDITFNANANVLGDLYWYNTTPNRLSIRAAGYYKIRSFVESSSAGSGDSYTILLRRTRSATPVTLTSITMSANDFIELDEIYQFNTDDYIELVISNSDNTGSILATSYLEIVREGV